MIKRVIKECMISFIENSRKCKLNCLGLKQISSCLGMKNCGEGHERRIRGAWGVMGAEETSESNGYLHYLDHGDHFMGVYICQNLANVTL